LVSRLLRNHRGLKLDAKDIVSQVFIEVATNKLPDNLSCLPLAYMHGIAKNLIRQQYRKFGKEIPVDFSLIENGNLKVEDSVEEDETINWKVKKMMQFLPDSCQKLLKTFSITDDVNEIADLLGYSNAETIHARKFQCLNKLASIITEKDPWLAKKLKKTNSKKK